MKLRQLFIYVFLFSSLSILTNCTKDDGNNVDPVGGEPEPPTDGGDSVASPNGSLLAFYKFEGNAKDASDNDMDATIVGDLKDVEGANGSSAYFFNKVDSVNECGKPGGSFVQLPNIGTVWQEGFTVTAWVEFTENRKYERIIDIGNGWGEEEGLNITLSRYDTLNDLVLTSWINSNPVTNRQKGRLIAKDVIKNGEMQFVAASISPSGAMKIYVDGKLVAQKEDGQPVVNSLRSNNYIGHSNYCEEDADFRGIIDELRLYKKNLTAAQIEYIQDDKF